MFTARSSLILSITTISLAAALVLRQEVMALASLTLIVWLLLEWLRFRWLLFSRKEVIQNCERVVDDQTNEMLTLSTDCDHRVRLSFTVSQRANGLRLWIQDTPPVACRLVSGSAAIVLDATGQQQISCDYVLRPEAVGKMGFPGIRVSYADSNGFFRHEEFIPLNQQLTVLPFLIRPQTTNSVVKRNNVQILTGHHRHRRAGLSAELLGIRDYQPGDPPRTIAWKPTARLGRLMSCEFESEVPIRTTLLVDLASYQFTGRPGPAAADRVIATSASIARLVLSDRDPVAAVLLSDFGSTRIPHGHGERQLTRLLQQLLAASEISPRIEHLPMDELIRLITHSIWHRFPQLLDPRFNHPVVHSARYKPKRRALAESRHRAALVLGQLLELDPALTHRLCFDDDSMRRACARFANTYSITAKAAVAPPSLDSVLSAQSETMNLACQRLLEGSARANDNELFVIVGRVPSSAADLQRLEDCLRVLIAAHHRVIFVEARTANLHELVSDPTAKRILADSRHDTPSSLRAGLEAQLFGLGVKMARIDDPQLMEQVAMEVDLVRSGRLRAGRRHVAGIH